MNQVNYKDILYAIKSDNLVLFSNFAEGNLDISFGRFPLLSLCYLYKSNKILKQYKAELCAINKYKVITEDFEIYQKFRTIAGRCLRLYISDNSIVSPVEMLALLHKDREAKKIFKLSKEHRAISEQTISNLRSIYFVSGQKVYICDSEIKITPRPLGKGEKLPYKVAISISLSFILMLSFCFVILNFSTGFGTTWNPYKIHNQSQLLKALNSGGSYELTSDIVLDKDISNLEFTGDIDGNNHTIKMDEIMPSTLISNNNGVIKNINIKYGKIQTEISESLSLFVSENNGTISNVKISCEELNLTCNKSEDTDIYISGFATTNNGTIENCSLFLSCAIETFSAGECSVSGIVGKNFSKVINCNLLKGSKIDANEADVAGICVENNEAGVIYQCTNNATISQASSIDEWSPNVSGVVLINYSSVEECKNLGDLTIISNNISENARGTAFLGGISALNYGSHLKCINNGNLKVTSENILVYCGGISAYSSYSVINNTMNLSVINKCGSTGNLDVTTTYEKAYAFAGGVCGYMYGKISDSYSLSTFVNDYNETKYFFGTCVGSSYLQYQFLGSVICIEASNNYMLSLINVDYQIGALIYNNSIVSTGVDVSNGITTYLNEDQVKQSGVYWYE